MRTVARYILTGCLMAAGAPLACGQQYPFLPVPGSPKNVKVLFQDSRGRLWMGGDGVASFDGTRVSFLSDYGFPAVSSYSIDEDAGGAIWIGAETGVYRFANGRVEEVAKGVAVSVTPIGRDMAVAAMGPLGRGIPANASLVRIQRAGDAWKTETIMSLNSPGPLTRDHTGSLLYPWPGEDWNEVRMDDIARWHTGTSLPVRHNGFSGTVAPEAGPIRVLRDRFGCVWIGSDSEDIYNCGDNTWHKAPFEGASVRASLTEAPDGAMLLSGYDILAVGRPGSFRVARPANGLPQLFTCIEAADGTIWVGGAQGLFRFASPFRMEYWTARDGIDNPWAVHRSGDDVYAGLNRSVGVLSKDRQHWQSIASFDRVGQVMNLLSSADGTITVALNPGFAAVIGRDGKILARSAALPSVSYGLRLANAFRNETWLGGIGLVKLARDGSHLAFENHRLDTQPAGNVLDVQYEEHTRKLWACYNGGLTERSEDGKWQEITTKDGLLVNACWSLAALPNGDVWYGYYNTPAFALIHPTADGNFSVRQFRASPGTRDPESINFDVDRRGWLWRGGNGGLSVADPAGAEAGQWLYLDQTDGLPGLGVNSGSYFADRDGSIWMGIDISIFHYNPPSDLLTPQKPPQVFLSSFSWNGGAPKLAESVQGLPHGARVAAQIGSLQFDRRNGLQLRYRVLPDRSSWRETQNLDLALGTMDSGAHTLEVQARLLGGPWSDSVSRPFTVLRPIWVSWRFFLAYFLTASLFSGGAYLLHRRRKAEEVELLPDLGAWRIGALLPEVHELAGTLLDSRFEVGELLARGGFANVMGGYDREQKQRCAIKIFRNEVKDKSWVLRSFQQELIALQTVRHPNVVTIYAHGSVPSGAPYLVMEFVEGRNLREIVEDGPLSPRRTARMLRQLAAALDAIHAQGICHRDVKPENVIVRNPDSPEEESILIDFSIAIVKDADETLHGLSRAAGSFDYMAPEQAIGYAQPSSDIYSLAKLVLELLTGRQLKHLLPNAAMDLPERVRELAKSLNLSLSQDSIEMLASSLEFDPGRRPSAAGRFAGPLVRDLEQNVRQRTVRQRGSPGIL